MERSVNGAIVAAGVSDEVGKNTNETNTDNVKTTVKHVDKCKSQNEENAGTEEVVVAEEQNAMCDGQHEPGNASVTTDKLACDVVVQATTAKVTFGRKAKPPVNEVTAGDLGEPKSESMNGKDAVSNVTNVPSGGDIEHDDINGSGEPHTSSNTVPNSESSSGQIMISVGSDDEKGFIGRSIVTSIVTSVRANSLSCVLGNKCATHKALSGVQLIPRNALSVLSAPIDHLKTQHMYEPVCLNHDLSRDRLFPIEEMYATDTNVFGVKQVDGGDRLFIFYGGRDVVSRFELLPRPNAVKTATIEPYRPDLFTIAVYVPEPGKPADSGVTTTTLPLATRHSRMLFVLDGATRDSEARVYGAAQMWFRNRDDMRAEFDRFQRLLCLDWLVAQKYSQITIAFTIEMPAKEIIDKPTVDVERIWKQHLASTGMYYRLPVEMHVDHSHGYYENRDFDSVTVHGYLMDGKTLAHIIGGDLKVHVDPSEGVCSDGDCGVRLECLVET